MQYQVHGAIHETERVRTGIPGLDEVLGGGLPSHRIHLIGGSPGTGKTTIALQFLLEGAAQGESVLYVTLSETVEEMRSIAGSHGWDLSGVTLRELAPTEESLLTGEQYTILHPEEVELGQTTQAVLEEVERSRPTRVVFDSMAELRLLARDRLRYRRQILGLKQFFAGRHCTVLFLDDLAAPDSGLESIAHSVLRLELLSPEFGRARRRLHVQKLRGGRYRGGFHDYIIDTGGVVVFPRLVAAEHHHEFVMEPVSSDVPQLDALLDGGPNRGTSALLIGPAGVGKSAIATQYAIAAARRGERTAAYLFDEGVETFTQRAEGLGMPVTAHVRDGLIGLRQLDPAELSPGEFVQLLRQAVEEEHARVVIIDSLNGYLHAMAEERAVIIQLHELLSYLRQSGVLTIMTIAQHGMVGESPVAPLDASYLADSVLLLRYFEAFGELRQAISVIKKRTGRHERSIRQFQLGPGVRVGEPLREFQGVLNGTPIYVGVEGALLADERAQQA